MEYELIFRTIEMIFQLILVIFAGLALFVWKREIRGRDKYKIAKELLNYIKELRFLIHSKNNSCHQIYVNDILVDKGNFYNDQLSLIKKEKVYFDQNIWGLFSHINTRSDIFLPEQIRLLLEGLYPCSGKKISSDKSQYTYIQIGGVKNLKIHDIKNDKDKNFADGIYRIHSMEHLTIEEYFKNWEKLIFALQKLT